MMRRVYLQTFTASQPQPQQRPLNTTTQRCHGLPCYKREQRCGGADDREGWAQGVKPLEPQKVSFNLFSFSVVFHVNPDLNRHFTTPAVGLPHLPRRSPTTTGQAHSLFW